MRIDNIKVTGSIANSGSLANLSGSFSGSFAGNGEQITGIVTASYATTASYAISSSHEIVQEITSSYADTASLAQLAETVDFDNIGNLPDLLSGSRTYATTASNTFNGNQIISGSLIVTGSSNNEIRTTGVTTISSEVLSVEGRTFGDGSLIESAQLRVSGTIDVTGISILRGGVVLGDGEVDDIGVGDFISLQGAISSSIIPTSSNTYDLGELARPWRNAYIDNLTGTASLASTAETASYILSSNIDGDITASTVEFDNITNRPVLYSGSAQLVDALEGQDLSLGVVSASILHEIYTTQSINLGSGSFQFGDTIDDTHTFTGSVNITGSLNIIGNIDSVGRIDTDDSMRSVFIGRDAGQNEAAGFRYNTGVGYTTLAQLGTGMCNTANGFQALGFVTSGSNNVGIGIWAGLGVITGVENTYIGSEAGYSFGSGGDRSGNTGVGYRALYSGTTAICNTALGACAGCSLTSGQTNTFVGWRAGFQATNGSSNVAIGANAGYSVMGTSNNTIIGFNTSVSQSTDSNAIVIGSGAVGIGDSTTVIGVDGIEHARIFGTIFEIDGISDVSASIANLDNLSASYATDSASLASRISDQENFSASLDATFATEAELNLATQSLSQSIAADLTTAIANVSGAFQSDSSSFAELVGGMQVDLDLLMIESESFKNFTASIQNEVDALQAVTGAYATTASNTFTGTQTIDSTGDARIVLDRNANSSDSEIVFRTNGTENWSIGTGQVGGDNDFTFRAQGASNVIRISQDGHLFNLTSASIDYVSASAFEGDGSRLTGLVSASHAETASYADRIKVDFVNNDFEYGLMLVSNPNENNIQFGTTDQTTGDLTYNPLTRDLHVSGTISASDAYFVDSIYLLNAMDLDLTARGTGAGHLTASNVIVQDLDVQGSITASNLDATASKALAVQNSSLISDTNIPVLYGVPDPEDPNFSFVTSNSNIYYRNDELYLTGVRNTGSLHQTGSINVTGSISVIGTVSGSFEGDGSNLTGLVSASYATTASHAVTASYALNVPDTASYATTASYALNALTASYAISSSHEIIQEITSSYAETASYALRAEVEITKEVSSSNADTASYVAAANIDGVVGGIDGLTHRYVPVANDDDTLVDSIILQPSDLADTAFSSLPIAAFDGITLAGTASASGIRVDSDLHSTINPGDQIFVTTQGINGGDDLALPGGGFISPGDSATLRLLTAAGDIPAGDYDGTYYDFTRIDFFAATPANGTMAWRPNNQSLDWEGNILSTTTLRFFAGGAMGNTIRITGSLEVTGDDSTFVNISASGHISASFFVGDGSQLTNIPASALPGGILSSSAQIAGDISGSFSVINEFTASAQAEIDAIQTFTSSIQSEVDALQAVTGGYALTASISGAFAQDSASFSSSIAELQNFSSSLDATFATEAELNLATQSLSQSLAANLTLAQNSVDALEVFSASAQLEIDAIQTFTSSIQSEVDALQAVTGGYAITSSISGAFTDLSQSFSASIASLEEFSASLDATFATEAELNSATQSLSQSLAQTATTDRLNVSGAFDSVSASFATDLTTTIANVSGAFDSVSSSIATDLTTAIANVSGAFASDSASIATNINTVRSNVSGAFNSTSASIATDISASDARLDILDGLHLVSGSNDTVVINNITASNFYTDGFYYGDGRHLTGVSASLIQNGLLFGDGLLGGTYTGVLDVTSSIDTSSAHFITPINEATQSLSQSFAQSLSRTATDVASLNVFSASAQLEIDSLQTFTSSIQSEVDALQAVTGGYAITSSISGAFQDLSQSFSASIAANATSIDANAQSIGSLNNAGLLSSSLQIADDISGSFTLLSSSLAQRITTQETNTGIDSASLAQTASFVTGSDVVGTVNSASHAITASYALNALTASYAISSSHEIVQEITSSYAETASYALRAEVEISKEISSSIADTASYIEAANIDGTIANATTASHALTASLAQAIELEDVDTNNQQYTIALIDTASRSIVSYDTFDLTFNPSSGLLDVTGLTVENFTISESMTGNGTIMNAISAESASQADIALEANTASLAAEVEVAPINVMASTMYPVFSNGIDGGMSLAASASMYFNRASETLFVPNFSGSFTGNIENATTASFAHTASYVAADVVTNVTSYRETVSGATSYDITHNLNERYPIVQAWNTTNHNMEIPATVVSNNVNQITVTFGAEFTGRIVVKI